LSDFHCHFPASFQISYLRTMTFRPDRTHQQLTTEQIREKIGFLRSQLPQKLTGKNYQLTYKHIGIPAPKKVKQPELQSVLQQAADHMCAHLLIARPVRILLLDNVPAGKFQQIDGLPCIFVNSDMTAQNIWQKIAIVAHELSHYYLIHQHRIWLDDELENELLTEVNAVLTGFGFLLHKGYSSYLVRRSSGNTTSKVGYIDIDSVKRIILQTAIERRQQPLWVIKNFAMPWDKLHARIVLNGAVREYRKRKDTGRWTLEGGQ